MTHRYPRAAETQRRALATRAEKQKNNWNIPPIGNWTHLKQHLEINIIFNIGYYIKTYEFSLFVDWIYVIEIRWRKWSSTLFKKK